MRRTSVSTIIALAGAVAALATAGPAAAAGGPAAVRVTTSQDSGPGSFRAAVVQANADPAIRRIQLRPGLAPIVLLEPLVYTGAQSLEIDGNGGVLDGGALGAGAPAAFLATGGGDLALARLTVREAPQQGLAYEVPADATGVRKVVLVGVQVLGNEGHGVLVDDQEDPEDVANQNGSDASLEISVVGSRFAGNGFGALDRDGLRVNEGGAGSLKATIGSTRFDGNGADGLELDERGSGDATFFVTGTQIVRNGGFDVTQADLDDGMDVDEWGEGALAGTVIGSSASDNFEEGWDFNENESGDFRVDMRLVEASRNGEEGIDFEEDDDVQGGGDLRTTLIGVRTDGNGPGGDAGLKIRERGDGEVVASVRGARASENAIGGISVREQGTGDLRTTIEQVTASGNALAGIALREDDVGSLAASVDRSVTDGNAGSGIDVDENAAGDLTASARRGSSSGNGGAGVRADQQASGVGALDLIAVALAGNAGGAVVATGVTVTQSP